MSLVAKQDTFTKLISSLINEAHQRGYQITFGEAWRSPETAKIYASQGKGIANSNHCIRLAFDLNFFKDGQLIERAEDLGQWWKSQSSSGFTCCWGGDFGDSDHFSLEHDGVK